MPAFFALLLLASSPVPDFTLRDLDRQRVSLSDFQGQHVLINFWATWCTGCRAELAELQTLHEAYGDQGLVVLAISIDDARTQSRVKPTVKAQGWTFPVLLDPQTQVVAQLHPSKSLPYFGLVSPQGELVWKGTTYTKGETCKVARLLEAERGTLTPSAEDYCAQVLPGAPSGEAEASP